MARKKVAEIKTCSKKGPWHAWQLVKVRRDTLSYETIYKCGCGYLGIQIIEGFTDMPPDPSKCEFKGKKCNEFATHLAGTTIFCKVHAPPDAVEPPTVPHCWQTAPADPTK